MMEVRDETIRDLIAAIDRLCETIGRRRKRQVPINGIRWNPKDPSGAERARRYRDRRRARAENSGSQPASIGIVAID